jgi:hypothetical protein
MPPTTPTSGQPSTGASTSVAPVPPPPAPTTVPLTIGGVTVQRLVTRNSQRAKTVLSKYERHQLDQNDRMTLFTNVTKHRGPKELIKALPNEITEPKQLDDFQHLDILIDHMMSHFDHYDVSDVFNIVFPDTTGNLLKDPTGSVKTVNLFHHFTDLSVVQVAASNRWYSEFTDDSKDQFHTNLEWTRVYFVNNVDAGLFTIINDNHKRHDREEQGGPLLFMLLMQELFFIAQKTATSLHTLMKQFRIDSVPGENIKSVSTTVMSISRRIWFSKKNTFPPEFLNTILKLYQTSSIQEFNAHFSTLTTDWRKEATEARIASLTSTTVATPPVFSEDLKTIQRLCDSANIVYEHLVREGLWSTLVKHKPSTTSQVLLTGDLGSHSQANQSSVSKGSNGTKKRRNQKQGQKMNKAKKTSSNADKKKGPSNKPFYKWRPPEGNESTRVISIKDHGETLHSWNATTKRWVPVQDTSVNVASAPVTVASTLLTAPNNGSDAALRVQLADVQRQLHALNARL